MTSKPILSLAEMVSALRLSRGDSNARIEEKIARYLTVDETKAEIVAGPTEEDGVILASWVTRLSQDPADRGSDLEALPAKLPLLPPLKLDYNPRPGIIDDFALRLDPEPRLQDYMGPDMVRAFDTDRYFGDTLAVLSGRIPVDGNVPLGADRALGERELADTGDGLPDVFEAAMKTRRGRDEVARDQGAISKDGVTGPVQELPGDLLLRELNDSYGKRTVRELRKLCKRRALKGYSKLRKVDLVDMLSKTDDRYLSQTGVDGEEVEASGETISARDQGGVKDVI